MAALAAVLVSVSLPAVARAQECRVVEVHMTPADDLQIVVWIEDAAGNYVDTSFITRSTGTYGLGNRPGMMEFNSGYRWPYGRRITTFPVWAHRHGQSWPLVVFQNWMNGNPISYEVEMPSPATTPEENLSHPLSQSSKEAYYCRPLLEGEPAWDAESCATTPGVFTDKGQFHPSERSLYPPRADLAMIETVDSDDAVEFSSMNSFDSVSRATPIGGEAFEVAWAIPTDLPDGDYVAWVEVSKEQDANAFYDRAPYGEIDLMWGNYGVPYLGQPSVVYQVPFQVSDATLTTTMASDYSGYGDPDGLDGAVRAADATITSDVAGSGASRLLLTADGSDMYRVKVVSRNEDDTVAPGATEELRVVSTDLSSAQLSFVATGDDGVEGAARTYEVRYLAGVPVTEDNFADATPAAVSIEPVEAGLQIDFTLTGLLPQTNYYIGVRAVDECLNAGPVTTVLATTPVPQGGEVDACFIATAAYGSILADDVADLRRFRDLFLRSNVTGEILVEAYYTFGPVLAETIEPSDTLREVVRLALTPVAGWARDMVGGLRGR